MKLDTNRGLVRVVMVWLVLMVSSSVMLGQTMERKALLVIDVQENLTNPHSRIHMDTLGLDLFFNNLNKNISVFDAEQDLVIYVVNEWISPLKNWTTGNVCKKGSDGVGLDERLLVVNDAIYSKSKPNALRNKDLLQVLKDNGVTDVYVMGLLAESCITATVKGLRREQFKVVVIEDALGSKRMAKKNKVLEDFRKQRIKTIRTVN